MLHTLLHRRMLWAHEPCYAGICVSRKLIMVGVGILSCHLKRDPQNPFGAAKPREAVLANRSGKTEDEILKEELSKDKLKVHPRNEVYTMQESIAVQGITSS